jgi:[glutamine synthetase] adenylyltransferase / [glutamine synthetase]-adenylyl-L-tyrosine phosphorylase
MASTADTKIAERIRKALARLSPTVPAADVDDYLARLDATYFTREAAEDIALHLRMATALGPNQRARLEITPREDGRYDVAVVAFDFFAELSLLCGLLTAHGLDIETGHAHTFRRVEAAARAPRRRWRPSTAAFTASASKIVDVFRVRPQPGAPAPIAQELERDLLELLALVAADRAQDARERLNLRLAETFARAPVDAAGALAPLVIDFDNQAAAEWTVMDVRGTDAPGFLYALTNAMATRGLYVHEVRIDSAAGLAHDRFLIGHADGRKLEAGAEQDVLRLAVALIKQFVHVLPSAPDPARALRYFDQFLDLLMTDAPESLAAFGSPESLTQLARLLGSSAFLWEDVLRVQFQRLLPVLVDWRARPLLDRAQQRAALGDRIAAASETGQKRQALNEYKDEQLLLVDVKRLLEPELTLERFSAALSALAEAVVESALDLALAHLVEVHGAPLDDRGERCPVALMGLGKFGGREMGYASDVELLVVYGGPGQSEGTHIENGQFFEELVRELSEWIAAREDGIFHVDLRLRPHGNKGPLASPLQAVCEYYRLGGQAAAFERQALIKLRRVAGDDLLGRTVETQRDVFVWSGEPWDRENALHLRDRQARELVPPGRFSVKYSPGALVDIEYATQYLQIQHGRSDLELRTPATLEALDRLRAREILSAIEQRQLQEAYVFWRRVADGLRMVRGNARDLLLPQDDSEELGFLARRLGHVDLGLRAAGAALMSDIALHRHRVRSLFNARFR